jgi:ribonucleoside-triphosphate reductase
MSVVEVKSGSKFKILKPTPKIVNIGDTYFGPAYKECKPFKLTNTFLDAYKGKKPNFGFNGLGEFVFYRTYSRDKAEGGKESFLDVAKRVVEGCYEIQRRHCLSIHIPWDYDKAQDSAQEMFDRMWSFKFLPPGRGLWMMGTDFMYARGSAALNNCGMTSTDMNRHTDPAEPYCFMMDMSMLGVGIGFDTKGAGQVEIQKPNESRYVEYEVHDSREGWVDSLRTLLHSYTKKSNNGEVVFNYEKIRPAGSAIGGFGGTAAGANILSDMHEMFRRHLDRKIGKTLSSGDIVDLMNYIGKCVVAGNVRRTAQIAFGEAGDEEYSSLKNPYAFLPDKIKSLIQDKEGMAWGRATNSVAHLDVSDFDTSGLTPEEQNLLLQGTIQWSALNNHRWASNNSVFAKVGMPYRQYEKDIATNGEPGFLWLENCRNFGRMIDGYKEGIDGEVVGSNPCAEQSLEDSELCCLVESFPNLHQDDEDYKRTLKFAFLYAKTVTLLPTHSARTNAVMLRNRRIGLSQSGIVQAFAQFGRREVLSKFCDEGYNVIKQWDKVYSRWLCIPQSIKITSVKPSGTVSLLTGCTPGIHYPEAQHYWRRVRVKSDSPLVQILKDAGYHIEPSVTDPANTAVIKFAVSDPRVKPTNEISIWEQVANTVDFQRYWADNQVSVTIKFKPEEAKDIVSVLEVYEDQLKSISFLPHSNHGYAQAPYEPCTEQEVIEYNSKLIDLDFSSYYGKEEGSKFCDGEQCVL